MRTVISARRQRIAAVVDPVERLTRPAFALLGRTLTPKPADPAQAPTTAAVKPEAEPYAGGDGPVGVLLLHGYTGSPRSMVGWGRRLEANGYRVSVPRLPGHGTSWPELNTTGWMDWYGAAEEAFETLSDACTQVFVAGLSMGGALALRLAQTHPGRISGLVLVNPVINITDPRMRILWLLKTLPSFPGIANDIARPGEDEGGYDRLPLRGLHSQTALWRAVQQDLASITEPLMIFRSLVDHVADPSSVELIRSGVSSVDQSYRELTRSFHVATLDYDAEQIVEGSLAFVKRLTRVD